MTLKYSRVFLLLTFLIFWVFRTNTIALPTDEVFEYDLKWLGIKAGTARLTFIKRTQGIKIISEAYSAPWVSVFYRVEDRAESVLKIDYSTNRLVATHYMIKLKEGSYRRNKEVFFLPEQNKAIYIDHIRGFRKSYDVPADVLDPLGGFLALRRSPLQGSSVIWIEIFDSKKHWKVRVKIIGREKIKTKAGEFQTVIVKPELQSEGIFSRKGDVYIYLTDDERRIPVMLKTRVAIGSVVAELVKMKRR